MSVDEFIDQIRQDLTVSCLLPEYLDPVEIERITMLAAKWMYKYYYYGTQAVYYYIPRDVFKKCMDIDNKIKLPCEVYAINNIILANKKMLLDFGVQVPVLNITGGFTTQPYIAATLSTIGDLAGYRVSIQNFSDMLEKLKKNTVHFSFNDRTGDFRLLTNLSSDLLLECEINIPLTDLLNDEIVFRYVAAKCKKQIARVLGQFTFQLPEGITINYSELNTEADAEITKIEEEIKSITNKGKFFTAH